MEGKRKRREGRSSYQSDELRKTIIVNTCLSMFLYYSSWGNHRSIFKRTCAKVGRKMVVIRNEDDRYRSRGGRAKRRLAGHLLPPGESQLNPWKRLYSDNPTFPLFSRLRFWPGHTRHFNTQITQRKYGRIYGVPRLGK